ncbi:MAG: single-stranded DNA-binding protein [Candidatus Kapabacteria bacterium]|nr:single-stranded DNA-binding protein [Candidatus Kapabacteria bacterium]
MSKSLNRAQLIGNLGKDPEMRTTPSGSSVCSFSLATTDSYKDKNGSNQESTEWHNIVLWDKLAEIAHQYLKKGSRIFIEGKIKNRSYEGKDGNTRYITEVQGNSMIMLSAAQSGSQSREYGDQKPAVSSVNDNGGQRFTPKDEHIMPDFSDDDVPF